LIVSKLYALAESSQAELVTASRKPGNSSQAPSFSYGVPDFLISWRAYIRTYN